MVTTQQPPTTAAPYTFTPQSVGKAIDSILAVLQGNSEGPHHLEAIDAFRAGKYEVVKRLASTKLDDYLYKALTYLSSAVKLTPNTDTILAEAARAAAKQAEQATLLHLGQAIENALGKAKL